LKKKKRRKTLESATIPLPKDSIDDQENQLILAGGKRRETRFGPEISCLEGGKEKKKKT